MEQLLLALALLCGPRGPDLADAVEREAHRFLIHPVLLAKVIAAESHCDNGKVSRKGALGFGQIMPGRSAARGYSSEQLLDPDINLYLTARHVAWCLTLCGDRPTAALSVYSNNSKKCRATAWSRHVLNLPTAPRPRRHPRRGSPVAFLLTLSDLLV